MGRAPIFFLNPIRSIDSIPDKSSQSSVVVLVRDDIYPLKSVQS